MSLPLCEYCGQAATYAESMGDNEARSELLEACSGAEAYVLSQEGNPRASIRLCARSAKAIERFIQEGYSDGSWEETPSPVLVSVTHD